MKHIPLKDTHEGLGAKMVDYAGFYMPVQYEGVNAEHNTVRNGVGVFDVSHMGEFLLTGEHALALIQKTCTNDASAIEVGKAQYSCFTNEEGGIIDDLIIYRMKEEEYLLVVNASNIDKDWEWLNKQNNVGAILQDLSDQYALLAIQGPKAIEAMQGLTSVNLSEIPYYSFKVGDFAGVSDVIISATGYTGSGGFEIYCQSNQIKQVWDSVFQAGASFGIKPIGLAARDTLRLEMGFCLYGNDIDETISPLEAGLGWITKFTKNFVGADVLKQQKEAGVQRKLIGFELLERGIPRQGYEILDAQGNSIGKVTSGTMAPTVEKGIGMGYVTPDFSKPETEIFIKIRNNSVKAQVVKTPFYKK